MKMEKQIRRKQIKYTVIAGCLSMIGVLLLLGGIRYAKQSTDSLSREMIRFHVVAHSDTTEDQLLKQQVRDAVIGFMEPEIKKCNSVAETRALLRSKLLEIREVAKEVIKENHQDYPVFVALDKANFPTKAYGDIILPAGEYEACRIIIGEGKGENWWCVMYPPLCYLDVACGVVPAEGKEQLEEHLGKAQYELVRESKDNAYKVRFKLIDQLNTWFHKEDYKEINNNTFKK